MARRNHKKCKCKRCIPRRELHARAAEAVRALTADPPKRVCRVSVRGEDGILRLDTAMLLCEFVNFDVVVVDVARRLSSQRKTDVAKRFGLTRWLPERWWANDISARVVALARAWDQPTPLRYSNKIVHLREVP